MLVHNFVTQHQIFSVGAAEIFLGANQLSSETVGAAPKTQRRTSGAAKAWIPPWYFLSVMFERLGLNGPACRRIKLVACTIQYLVQFRVRLLEFVKTLPTTIPR